MTTKYIAHITIEAQTPLKVGSNSSDFLQDSPIQKDWNGLPMILGTSIAGVLRKHYRDEYKNDDLFGFQRMENENDLSEGSKVILSNALLLDKNKKVNEGLLLEKSSFLKIFDNLPIREHTKIDHRGVTGNSKEFSKFDEEVVYKGSQFKFSLEVIEDKEAFEKLIELLKDPSFRLGGGTTKGFGKFRIVDMVEIVIDSVDDLVAYSSSLDHTTVGTNEQKVTSSKRYIEYTLKIKPDDFFMFGSGFGDTDADQTPVYEKVVVYANANAKLTDKQILIPASSIKGALSHRTAFHYNKEMLKQEKDHTQVDENNEAVKAIFGHKKEMAEDKKTELGQKGKVLFSDCFKEDHYQSKTFDHVSIDRFTGGAIDGHLFQEKTIARHGDDCYELEILVEKSLEDTEYIKAFEKALCDVTTGMLALGGATTKGHGVFSGTLEKDGKVITDGKCNNER